MASALSSSTTKRTRSQGQKRSHPANSASHEDDSNEPAQRDTRKQRAHAESRRAARRSKVAKHAAHQRFGKRPRTDSAQTSRTSRAHDNDNPIASDNINASSSNEPLLRSTLTPTNNSDDENEQHPEQQRPASANDGRAEEKSGDQAEQPEDEMEIEFDVPAANEPQEALPAAATGEIKQEPPAAEEYVDVNELLNRIAYLERTVALNAQQAEQRPSRAAAAAAVRAAAAARTNQMQEDAGPQAPDDAEESSAPESNPEDPSEPSSSSDNDRAEHSSTDDSDSESDDSRRRKKHRRSVKAKRKDHQRKREKYTRQALSLTKSLQRQLPMCLPCRLRRPLAPYSCVHPGPVPCYVKYQAVDVKYQPVD